MATPKVSQVYYVTIGSVKYAWRANKKAYDGILDGLGVKKGKDTDDNIVFGANQPKPARVRINLKDGRSIFRWCDPDKVAGILSKNTLNGKKYQGKDIDSVTLA